MDAPMMTSEANESKSRQSRTWTVGLAVALAVVAAAYFASPVAALYALKSAVQSGSKDRLDALVDFPAVRDNLKSQFNARIVQAMNGPDVKDNPFAGLAALMAPALIDRMVDTAVTPDGLSALLRNGKIEQDLAAAPSSAGPEASAPQVRRMGYVTLDRFKVSVESTDKASAPLALVLERRGALSWKLVGIDLPRDSFAESPTNSN